MTMFQNIKDKINLTPTKKVIAQNLFWAVLGKFINLLSGLIVGIIVARYLCPEQYGLMNYVISFVFLFQTFAIFGLDAIEIREESKQRIPVETIIGTAFYLKIILGSIFMILTIVTSYIMEADRYTIFLVSIYSLSIVLNSFSVIKNYFTSIVQNEYIVKAEISRTVLSMIIKVILLIMQMSLTWFVFSYMLDFLMLASGYIAAYRAKSKRISEWHFDCKYAFFLLKESFPLMLTSTAVIIYQRIDQVMIGQMIDKTAVGYFSVASRLVEILIYIPMTLSQTITPILVRALERDKQEYIRKSQQFMNLSLWLSTVAAIATAILANLIITIAFGKTYAPAIIVLQIMAFKVTSVALSNTAGAMLVSEGLQKYAIFRDISGCIVCITLNYFLLPIYGIVAAAFISIISNIVAGYIADAVIPPYRHIFIRQSKALLYGWRDLFALKIILRNS